MYAVKSNLRRIGKMTQTRSSFKRVISLFLVLAMVCPVLAYFAAFGANAALIPERELEAEPSGIINEEWNFDDMSEGEAVTKGYVRSHTNGNFSVFLSTEVSEKHCAIDGWTAVKEDDGNIAVESMMRNFSIRDESLVLLKNTYEVSFRIKILVPNSTTATLFYWSEYEKMNTRHGMIRLDKNGTLGYREGDNNSTQIWTGVDNKSYTVTMGEDAKWHDIKIRVNPVSGRVLMWLDGTLCFDFVNTNLKTKAATAEYSSIGIYYAFEKTAKTRLDDIKITNPKVDEYIDFSMPAGVDAEPIDVKWDMEDGKFENKDGVTVSKTDSFVFAEAGDDSANTTKRLYANETASSEVNANVQISLPGVTGDYSEIKLSWKLRIDSASGWFNVGRVTYKGSSTNNMVRVPALSAGGSDTARHLDNVGKMLGTITAGEWIDYTIAFYPHAGKAVVKIGDTETELTDYTISGKPSVQSMLNTMLENDSQFKIQLFYWVSEVDGEAYFDDLSIYAAPYVPSAEEVVNGAWKDPSFSMIDSPVPNMDNDDWQIAEDPILSAVAPNGKWDFNNLDTTSVDGITAAGGTDASKFAYYTEKDADGKDNGVLGGADQGKSGEKNIGKFTLEGKITDYKTIEVSYKIKYGSGQPASNYTNLFCMLDADGKNWRTMFRVQPYSSTTAPQTVKTNPVSVNYRVGTSDSGAKSTDAKFTLGAWNTIKVVITPSTGNVVITVNGSTKTFTNTVIQDLYSADKAFTFLLYRHTNDSKMLSEFYVDDVEIKTTYQTNSPDGNTVLKTLTDDAGITHGIFAIKDKELLLTKQPFEISFDYMLNQTPSGYLNLLKFDMNGQSVSVFRLMTNRGITNYTSSAYNGVGKDALNLEPNVTGVKTLTLGRWYNVRAVVNPLNGHVQGYLDNVLISDFNLNEYYITNTPDSGIYDSMDVTKNPTKMLIEITSQYQSSIKVNDSCVDNLRIRTLDVNESTDSYIGKAKFENVAARGLNAATFSDATELYAKSLSGSFEVKSTDGSAYMAASVGAGDGVNVDMTSNHALATDTVVFEGNFAFTAFGDSGRLDIYSLKRGDATTPLLSVDAEGQLYIGSFATGAMLSENKTAQIKLVYGGAFGTAELYLDGLFVTAKQIITELPALSYTDGDLTVKYGYNKYLVAQSASEKTLSGVAVARAVAPDFTKIAYPEDTLVFLAPEGEGTWNVKLDDLAIYKDSKAYFYADSNAESFNIADVNGRLWGNSFVVDFTYAPAGDANLVTWNIEGSDVVLAQVIGGKLYAADGTTELADLSGNSSYKLAFAITTSYWEGSKKADNYTVKVKAFVDGESVTAISYFAKKAITSISSGALMLADGASDLKLYYGDFIKDTRTVADASGVKFDGYTAFSLDFEDEIVIASLENNIVDYADWLYPSRGKTASDVDGATVAYTEVLTEGENSFMRIRRPELSSKPVAYMEYNLSTMGEYKELYSVSMDIRYTDTLSSSLRIATLYTEDMASSYTLLCVAYDGSYYFENNGIRYYICDRAGNLLTVNAASSEEFSSLGFVVNEKEGTYSIWVDGMNAYYYADGQKSGAPTPATAVSIKYVDGDSIAIAPEKIRLFEGSNYDTSDTVADLDNVSIDVIKNGLAPVNFASQAIKDGSALRFIATVDTLFYNYVGFEVEIDSELHGVKAREDKTNVVFNSIVAAGNAVTAEDMDGRYISTITVTDLAPDVYEFTVIPFVEILGEKIYGAPATYAFDGTHLTAVE